MRDNSRDADQQFPLSSELAEFAAQLRRLEPRDDRLDRERIAFLAGQASMVERSADADRVSLSRVRSRVWPAAFAAMTGAAATLLALLLMRPAAVPGPAVVNDERRPSAGPVVAEGGSVDTSVLTPRGVWTNDPEAFLTKFDGAEGAAGAVTTDGRGMPVFTPAAWQQVIEEFDSAAQSSGKSSEVLYKRGISI